MRKFRYAVLAAALSGLLVIVGACGNSHDATPIKIGLLVDCSPPLDGLRQSVIAAVESPLIQRGAAPVGRLPSQGLRGAQIDGHPVEILEGCSELGIYSRMIEETRRLVEDEGADIVIGPPGAVEGTVLRQVANRYPKVTFLLGWSGASSVTFSDPAANVFRFGPTSAQGVAGLATYAYRDLGWRTAAIVADDYSAGWEYAASFSAEFCALGGRITSRDYASLFLPAADATLVRRARAADGVAILSVVGVVAPLGTDAYISAYARGVRDLSRRVVLGGPSFAIPANLDWRVKPAGVVVAEDVPSTPNAAGNTLARALAAFPGLPEDISRSDAAIWPAEAADAVIGALARTGGDLSDGQRRLRAALSSLPVASPRGPVRLDANRQGIDTAYLWRVRRSDGPPTMTPLRSIPGVDQTLGGLLTSVPERSSATCARRTPPPSTH